MMKKLNLYSWLRSEAGRPAGAAPLAFGLCLLLMISAWAQSYRFVPEGFKVGGGAGATGTTLEANGDADFDGTVTAAAFVGDGSGLTGVSGFGDVTGPGSSTDNALTRYDSTTGKVIQNSAATLDDSGNLTAAAFIGDGSGLTGLPTSGIADPGSSVDNEILRWNGTTGDAVQASGITIADGASGTLAGSNSGDVALAGTPDYLTISGQTITRGLIDVTTDITGDVPFANIEQLAQARVLGRTRTGGSGDATPMTLGDLAEIAHYPIAMTLSTADINWTLTEGIQYAYTLPGTGAALTVQIPSGTPVEGRLVMMTFTQQTTACTVSWNAVFIWKSDRLNASIPAVGTGNGDVDIYLLRYFSGLSKWLVLDHIYIPA